MPERQVDTGRGDCFTLGKGVEPMALNFTSHDKEAAVFKFGGNALFSFDVFEVEASLCTKTQTSNRRMGDDGRFVVAMP